MVFTRETWPKDRWPNFSVAEMACTHCGVCDIAWSFMDELQALRTAYGHSMIVTSGYRCPEHPIEVAKDKPGAHASGKAVDIGCHGLQCYNLLSAAESEAWTGFGIAQRSGSDLRFLHLDTIAPGESHIARPRVWSY